MSDGNDRKLKKQVFHSKSNLSKSYGKKNQINKKSSSNYLFEENCQYKIYNETLMKKNLVQKSYAVCRTEKNYQKNKILDENVYLLELIVFDDWVTKISLKPVNNSPT